MHKMSHLIESEPFEFSFAPVMDREQVNGGFERLVLGVPGGDSIVFSALVRCIEEPFYILYVLHTPRGEGLPGRYQSPELSNDDVSVFLERYSSYLGQDARHDFWVRSQSSNATIVWDRHNIIYAYGPISKYESALRALGFSDGYPSIPSPHIHHYHSEFDGDAKALLNEINWCFTDLRPEDEQ